MQSMAGHFTGPSAGQYPAPKPPPEAPSADTRNHEHPERLPNGQAHLVRRDKALLCSCRAQATHTCCPVQRAFSIEVVIEGGKGMPSQSVHCWCIRDATYVSNKLLRIPLCMV